MNRELPEPMPYRRRGFQPAASLGDPNKIELGVLFGGMRRNKWLILAGILASVAIAALVLRGAEPVYEARAEVLLETRQEQLSGIKQVISDLSVSDAVVAGEIAVLQSNLLIGRVVDRLNLIRHPDFDPYRINEPNRIQRLFESVKHRIDTWRSIEIDPRPQVGNPSQGELSPVDARNLVIWQVRRNLTVAQSGIAYVIGISARASNPQIAAAIANSIAEQYLLDQQAIKQAATQRAIVWLDNRLAELETQLRNAEDAVVDFLAELSLKEDGNEESVGQQLAELNRSFVIAHVERSAMAARLDHLRALLAEGGHEQAAVAMDSPRLARLDEERAALEREMAQVEERLGRRHPEMMALRSAIYDLRRDRHSAIENGLSEIEAQLYLAQERETALREAIRAAHERLIEFSRSSIRLRQLERSAAAMRQVYESFLARFQETTQQVEFHKADARIISEAPAPLAPSRPRKTLVLAAAFVLGAVVGIAASLVREVINRTVRTAADLARVTHLPVLSSLPRMRRRGRSAGWQAAELRRSSLSPYAEGLRLLRAALMNTRSDAKPRIVMFTGSEAGVGASSAAVGFGRVMTAIGSKVVLVDSNLRRPAAAALLGLTGDRPDLLDHLGGRADLDEALVGDGETDLAVLPTRRGRQNGADVVSSAAFGGLMERLAKRFDLVILDAPPAVGVADAKVLAGIADATVLVVRAGVSRESGIGSAILALEDAGGLVAGTVINQSARYASGWTVRLQPLPDYETAA